MRSDVAFIIPVYNEETVVRGVVENVLREYPNVVCVNDCSRDGSAAEIVAAGAFLVNHPINMGQGAALQTGVEFARQLPGVRYFVTYDADGQHRLEDVATMLATIEESGDDIIMGSRFLGQDAVGMSGSKRVVLKLATAFSNALSGLKLTDTHNGLRVFNRRVAEELQITMPDMAHASEILEIVAAKKYRYREVPVTIVYTEYSRGKGQSIVNAINIAFDALLRKVSR
jgi:glycosyltransferase involved in cell wall biosynthesis